MDMKNTVGLNTVVLGAQRNMKLLGKIIWMSLWN